MKSSSTVRTRKFWPLRRGLARNSTLSVLQSIVGVGTYFLVMRHVVQVAGLEGVGLWSLTMGFVALVRLMDLSGANGLARMVAMNEGDHEATAAYIDTLSLFIAGLYLVICMGSYLPLRIVVTGSVDAASLPLAESLLIWAIISLPLNVLGLAQLSALDGIGRADIRSIINIAGFMLFAVLAAVFLPAKGILGLAYAQFTQYIFVLIATRTVLFQKIPGLAIVPFRFNGRAARDSLHYGFRLQAASIPMVIFDPMTRILLGRWVGLEYLGVYDLSYKLAGNTRTLIQASLQPIVPEFTRLHRADPVAANFLHTRVSQTGILVTAGAFSALILACPLLSLFLLSKISPIFIFSTSIFAVGWGVATFGLPTQLYARAAGFLRWSILGQWSLVVLGAPLSFAAYQWLGQFWIAAGAALAIVIGHLIAFAGEARMLRLRPVGAASKTRVVSVILVFVLLGVVFASIAAMFRFEGI